MTGPLDQRIARRSDELEARLAADGSSVFGAAENRMRAEEGC